MGIQDAALANANPSSNIQTSVQSTAPNPKGDTKIASQSTRDHKLNSRTDDDDDAWVQIPDDRPLHKRINWLFAIVLSTISALAMYGVLTVPWQRNTAYLTIAMYFYTGLSITAGYHRLWSHRAYNGTLPLRLFFAFGGASAIQGTIRWWCRGHRAHHRYTDTHKDPYSAKRGMLWAHIGWLYMLAHPRDFGRVDMDDLKKDPVVKFQNDYFVLIALTIGIVLPTCIAGFGWGDWAGGFFYASMLRMVIVQHATFSVNSIAHWLGEASFDDKVSPRDHIFTALITLGEGYHNFHHEFPNDYRNAIGYTQYDPTKWLINVLHWLGLASKLKRFSQNEIQKGRLVMDQKRIDRAKAHLDWGRPIDELPIWTRREFDEQVKSGEDYILIDGVVYDVLSFMDDHPGGRKIMQAYVGRDATRAFNGGVYDHNNSARNLMAQFRVAKIGADSAVSTPISPDIPDLRTRHSTLTSAQ